MPTLEDTLIRTNNVLAALEGLIGGDAAETPVPDESVAYALATPTFNESNDEWTLTQDTADTDGLYKGLYKLAISTGCSTITIVSHDIVTPDDNVPARYMPCGGSLTDVASVSTVDGEQISKVEFRSKNPFTVTIKLAAQWCNLLDFRVQQHGFQFDFPERPDGLWQSGTGFVPEWGNQEGYIAQYGNNCYFRRIFTQSFTFDKLVVRMTGTNGATNRNASFTGYLNGSLVFTYNTGKWFTDGQIHDYEYIATHTVDEVRISVTAGLSVYDDDAFAVHELQIEGSTGDAPTNEAC